MRNVKETFLHLEDVGFAYVDNSSTWTCSFPHRHSLDGDHIRMLTLSQVLSIHTTCPRYVGQDSLASGSQWWKLRSI